MNDTRITSHTQKRPTIFVSGPSSSCDADTAGKGRALGHAIARGQAILLTGTGNGFARYVAEGAMSEGGTVIGLSPASNVEEHTSLYGLSTLYHDTIIYTGFGYAGRDMLLSRSADAMIVGSGDVAHAYDIMLLLHEKKPCGVLEGPWLLDDTLKELFTRSGRTREGMVFSPDSETLVTRILEEIRMTRMRA
ncbi:MAG: hypothetical protein HGB03_02430 [Candidatus Yonathbacteria bacterium]|nr:hypothetical protein [Candidatus Yonathbacteria bacterium]NTW47502.1 hypothetical protein [Candidatus Yonathbacteria bacterium]